MYWPSQNPQENDAEREFSEIKQMTKHIVHTVKVEKQMIIKIAVQRKESVQGSSDHASLVHRGGGVEGNQTARQTLREPGEAAH